MMHRGPHIEWLASQIWRHVVERFASDPPLTNAPSYTELSQRIGATITAEGIGLQAALRLWTEEISRAALPADHPRFLAFIPCAPTDAAILFDALVTASSIYGGTWLEASGSVYAENQVLRWLADLAGFPAGAGGCFVQGGTTGNISALIAARHTALEKRKGSRPQRWVAAISDETHSSVRYGVEQVMDANILLVPTDDHGRLRGEDLRKTVEQQGTDGLFAVVATAGSTNRGVIDDLEGIANVCAELGVWMHVDGAYGAAALAAPSARRLFRGIERADSFVVDPHKWLFAPFDSCALLYRHPELARRAHTQHAAYLAPVLVEGPWNPSDYAIHLSRRPRGLPMWFSLAAHGTRAYSSAIEGTLAVAREFADEIRRRPNLELLAEPTLSIVVFHRSGWSADDYERWSENLRRDGTAFVTPTSLQDQPCARVAIVNPRTTRADLIRILDSMA